MITIFDRTEKFPGKVNFIDDRNNLIGFDMESSCCEDFGWIINGTEYSDKRGGGIFILEEYYFNKRSLKINRRNDEGGEIIITLRGKKRKSFIESVKLPNLYLHIFNNHNGYYSHGFELSIDDEKMVCSI